MIPELIDLGGEAVWTVLPPGIHWTSLEEAETRFATNHRRIWLFEGLKMVAGILSKAGCSAIYLDGSFVTGKPLPNDFDMCWDPEGVRSNELPAIFSTHVIAAIKSLSTAGTLSQWIIRAAALFSSCFRWT